MLPLGSARTFVFEFRPPFLRARRHLVLPIADDAFLPEVVSLQAKPPCDLAGDCDGRGRTLGPRRLPVRVSCLS